MKLNHCLRLIAFKAWADLRAERARTYLGLLWWIFEPALFMAVFYIIFGLVRGKGGADFVAFLLVGVVSWQWFRASVTHCGNSIVAALPLMRQVVVPAAVFPLVVILSDGVKFAFVLCLLIAVLAVIGYLPGTAIVYLPFLLLVQLGLSTALGLLYASLVPLLPDIKYVVEALLMAMMFMSGIFYSIDDIDPVYRVWLELNPMVGLIQGQRAVLIDQVPPDVQSAAASGLISLLLLFIAVLVLRKLKTRYTKLPF